MDTTELIARRRAFCRNLQAEGRWKSFLKRRRAIGIDSKLTGTEAHITALDEFGFDPDKETPEQEAVTKATFAGKEAGVRKSVEWVAANISIQDVKATDAVSAFAWNLLCWVKKDADNEAAFYKDFCAKLLPTRQQLETDDRHTDDGTDVSATVDELLSAESAVLPGGGAKEAEGEFEVPKGRDPARSIEPKSRPGTLDDVQS